MADFDLNLGGADDLDDIPPFWAADFPSWAALILAVVGLVIAVRALRRTSYIEFHRDWRAYRGPGVIIVTGRVSAISEAVYLESSGEIRRAGKWLELESVSLEGHAFKRGVVTCTFHLPGELSDETQFDVRIKISATDGSSRKQRMTIPVVRIEDIK